MRALLQRVSRASVTIGGDEVGSIGAGLLVLLGVATEDNEDDLRYLVERALNLRIFPGDDNRFDRSALDIEADILVVSQFTLYANTRRGRRPDFTSAAAPDTAERLYQLALERFRESGLNIASGRFGEYMSVDLVNDGPVTLMLDSVDRLRPRRAL